MSAVMNTSQPCLAGRRHCHLYPQGVQLRRSRESEDGGGHKPVSSPAAHSQSSTNAKVNAGSRCSVVSLPKSTSGAHSKALQIQLNETQEKYLDHIFNAYPEHYSHVYMTWPLIMVILNCC